MSLDGLERFAVLECLNLHYNTSLSRLAGGVLPCVQYMTIEKSPKLGDYESLTRFANLIILRVFQCGAIKSVGFVDQLRNLRSFRFIGTDVLDGDLSKLLRLEDVEFTQKRHFSHKSTKFGKGGETLQRLNWLTA
jgi:hypothetical protein